jgi:hypothetical protein
LVTARSLALTRSHRRTVHTSEFPVVHEPTCEDSLYHGRAHVIFIGVQHRGRESPGR